jgi:hypothetical protein
MGFYSLFFRSFTENRSPKEFCKSSFLGDYILHVNLLGIDVLETLFFPFNPYPANVENMVSF